MVNSWKSTEADKDLARARAGARAIAHRVLGRVEAAEAYADILLDAELKGLSGPDAGLATEITYGVLRWKIRLDYTIDLFSSVKTRKLEHRVLNALRIGAYQILFLTRVPVSAAINESVELAKAGGSRSAGFVNAVLRKIASEKGSIAAAPATAAPVKAISIEWSHPEWMVARWAQRYGIEEAERLCRADQEAPPRTIRANTLAISRQELLETLVAEGFDAAATSCSPDGIEVRAGGPLDARDRRYYIQDEASQLVCCLLAPSPGEAVLDACSAPGGKTTHMAALMGNRGAIYAVDRHAGRLETVRAAAERLGAGIIKTFAADSAVPLGFLGKEKVDAILCDAPCSGLGVLRRVPDMKYRRREEDLAILCKLQAALLDNLAGCLKPGGRLVYSTCTFEPEETDMVAGSFLERRPEFTLANAACALPPSCSGLVDEKGFFRSYPHRHGMDGFFAALLRKG